MAGPPNSKWALPLKHHLRSVKSKSLETKRKITKRRRTKMMERAITVRELHAAVYPTDVEANGNGFWQRSLRALQDILPARIFVDEQEQQEIMNMSAIEKEKYLLWAPLQTILLESWENEERGTSHALETIVPTSMMEKTGSLSTSLLPTLSSPTRISNGGGCSSGHR